MSGANADSFHLGLVFDPERSEVPMTASAPSRKRPADVSPSEVPSASRRRRSNNSGPSAFINPRFTASCCTNGVDSPTTIPGYLLHPSHPAERVDQRHTSYRQQLTTAQIHSQLASTSPMNRFTYGADTSHILPNTLNSGIIDNGLNSMDAFAGRRFVTRGPSVVYPPVNDQLLDRFLPRFPIPPAAPPQHNSSHHGAGILHPHAVNPEFIPNQNQFHGENWRMAMESLLDYSTQAGRSLRTIVLNRVRQLAAAEIANQDHLTALQFMHQLRTEQHALQQFGHPVPFIIDREGPVAVPTFGAEMQMPRPNFIVPSLFYDSRFYWSSRRLIGMFDYLDRGMPDIRLPNKGMSKVEIEQLGAFRLSDPTTLKEKVCVICQSDFEKKELIRALPCDHHYHQRCIDKWLKLNRTCPICRKCAADHYESKLPRMYVEVVTQVDGGRGGGGGGATTTIESSGSNISSQPSNTILNQQLF